MNILSPSSICISQDIVTSYNKKGKHCELCVETYLGKPSAAETNINAIHSVIKVQELCTGISHGNESPSLFYVCYSCFKTLFYVNRIINLKAVTPCNKAYNK